MPPSLMKSWVWRNILMALICVGPIAVPAFAAEPVALHGYNAAIGESSISGISSGAFMAVQFATAWSSVIKGLGVVAGGILVCASGCGRHHQRLHAAYTERDRSMHEGIAPGPKAPF